SQNLPEKISRVSLCGGSGADFWKLAKNRQAEIYITADMKYHELISATHSGLVIAVADHGEMERASLPKLAEKISECGVETVLLNVNALTSPLRM
ncbi:MAG: Nif3-like dinuclear metal center hexameric protein, partial [Synergistaceae bacterium]|nr:Nif3-like dinuclear metal center hexameric protein [Synergistaceae bacterium]